jgi:hypothetical protein
MFDDNKKVISIHQPNYIPWLGYFYKIYLSDIFVFLDDAQFSNEGMHNWHYIKTPQGPLRMKIPVQQKLGDKINEVRTKDELGWKQKHLKAIVINYKKSLYFEEIYNDFSSLLLESYPNLASMNKHLIIHVCKKFGIKTKIIESSSLNIYTSSEQKVIDIVNALNGTDYYSGLGAKAYQNEDNFIKRNIHLTYIQYLPYSYKQLWGDFRQNVSVLDYMMNCGYNWEDVIKSQKSYL